MTSTATRTDTRDPSSGGTWVGERCTVSVLLSVYNAAPHLRRCIDSLLGQTWRDFELLVMDDGSTDDSARILAAYDDPRLQVYRQSNSGLTVTLNRLLAMARGRYVARQDADDYSLPERLERQVAFLDHHPDIALVGAWSAQVDDDDEIINRFEPDPDPEILDQQLVEQNPFIHGSWLFRREAVEAIGGYREAFRYSQDYDLLLRLKETCRMSNLPEVLYAKRHTPAMVSVGNSRLQVYYAELAQRCWRERLDFGTDHVERGEFEAPEDADSKDVKNGMVLYHKHLVSAWSRRGNAAKLRAEIRQLLKISPWEPFSLLQYLLSFGGGRFLRMLSGLWDGLRRE